MDVTLQRGRILCLVGESGSGKSLTALSLMRLLPSTAHLSSDKFVLDGKDIADADEYALNSIRGNRMAMVFQEPMTALNPVMTVGDQVTEALMVHQGLTRQAAFDAALEMFRRVQIPAPETRLKTYPHQLSGGMRQRVMIAMALICRPAILIADEPTTALDVTIQSQILRLIDQLRSEFGTAVLFITHNLAVVAEIADEIAVMYAGRIVERTSRTALFGDPMHPYTLALFAAMPRTDERGRALAAIEGQVPSPGAMPSGCRFAPRCPFTVVQCSEAYPPLREIKPDHWVSCWRAPLEEHVT
ncbi:ABC transporter ATP-binding protein [Bradyrhizobium sp. AZCC 2230]|uniref:ABC transporter ATP-binding protein n=1 Tax=Bradyrhizobium sp. AZCC 2230 TaxID=3117021 RepID=UPI002FEF8942